MKLRAISPQQAAAFTLAVKAAPMLPIDAGDDAETPYHVKRIGYLPDRTSYLETVAGTLYRLPIELDAWVNDVVPLAIVTGVNPFPAWVRFGVTNERHWVEID